MVNTQRPRWSVTFPKPFESVQREMDQLLDNVFTNGNGGPAGWHAAASLWEEEGHWCVDIDLPGVQQDDVDVILEKNTLRISAERKPPQEDRKFWHQERAFGRIERLISLPEAVDHESIEAELQGGVLHLRLSKRPESQPRKISVKAK